MDAFAFHQTPLGVFALAASQGAVTRVWLPEEHPSPTPNLPTSPVLAWAFDEIDAYFEGSLRVFSVPVSPNGTPFQQAVWAALLTIPSGQTRTYGELAAEINRPGAARAVGRACNRNPLPIFIPCHRAVSAQGIGGFRGGTALKQALLALESPDEPNALECEFPPAAPA